MSNTKIKDGTGVLEYLRSGGAGTDADPHYPIPGELMLEIARGNIPGVSFSRRFGKVPTLLVDTPTDVWRYGSTAGAEIYTWSTTADIDSISSDNAGDLQNITISGLDANYIQVNQTIALNGQTRVALTTPLMRINQAFNDSGTDLLGNVYIYVNTAITGGIPDDVTKVRAYIDSTAQQSQNGIFTVAAGKTGFITSVETSMIGRKDAFLSLKVKTRLENKVFLERLEINLAATGTSIRRTEFPVPIIMPEKIDFLPTAESTIQDAGLIYVTEWLFIDN